LRLRSRPLAKRSRLRRKRSAALGIEIISGGRTGRSQTRTPKGRRPIDGPQRRFAPAPRLQSSRVTHLSRFRLAHRKAVTRTDCDELKRNKKDCHHQTTLSGVGPVTG
jgi:hypothetical protein